MYELKLGLRPVLIVEAGKVAIHEQVENVILSNNL